MKNLFSGYYAPSAEQFDRLWTEAVIVLDTNVLLDLYRLPETARNELLAVLEVLSDRIWIPHQVALEFQRRRLTVIAAERKVVEDVLSDAKKSFESIKSNIESLQIEKRGVGVDPSDLIDELNNLNSKFIEALGNVHGAQMDIAMADPIRDWLDNLLFDKVGAAPESQQDLEALCQDGESRYNNKIPPGYGDIAKDKNPNEATFYHDGICYERKYGDLILWRQLIAQANKENIKSVLLITSDTKEDWWWREKGRTIGPRHELSRELEKNAGVELFWMYSASQFLEAAGEFNKSKVTEQSVSELEGITRDLHGLYSADYDVDDNRLNGFDISRAQEAVFNWLQRTFGKVSFVQDFPDFIINTPEGAHGYQVLIVEDEILGYKLDVLVRSILMGCRSLLGKKISKLYMVMVTENYERSFYAVEVLKDLLKHLDGMSNIDLEIDVIIGNLAKSGKFSEFDRSPIYPKFRRSRVLRNHN